MELKANQLFNMLAIILALTITSGPKLSIARSHHQEMIGGSNDAKNYSLNSLPSVATQSVFIKTTSGLLQGTRQPVANSNGHSVYKFLSVPYAEAPINELRFQRPQELISERQFQRVDATKFGKTCPQYRHLTRFISPLFNVDHDHQVSEDCLQLNIFVPDFVGKSNEEQRLELSKQLPIIVWIPGEGFDFADARQFDGSQLAQRTQSIVVTVQYRVGVLGFLQAPRLGIKGNMGIYDQIMAIKWVRRNAPSFGGDSDQITLMGRFSGSMSISAMITSPNQQAVIRSNGELLFQRVALLSGLAVDKWSISESQHERVIQLTELALQRGFCNETQLSKDNCLQSLPVDQLLNISDYGWRMVPDNELIGQLSPLDAVRGNQFAADLKAVMLGETAQEGTLCLYRHMLEEQFTNYANLIENDQLTTEDLYEIIGYDSKAYFGLNFTSGASNPIKSTIESLLETAPASHKTHHQQAITATQRQAINMRDRYLNACSAYMMKSHSNRFRRNIMLMNKLSVNRLNFNRHSIDVYHYELKYKPSFSLAPGYIRTAAHGDDVPLIFGLIYNLQKSDINESDLVVTRKMMSYVGNFVHGFHPMLKQHGQVNGDSDINQMDTEDMIEQSGHSDALPHRSWSRGDNIDSIELNDNDIMEPSSLHKQQVMSSDQKTVPSIRLVLVGNSQAGNYVSLQQAELRSGNDLGAAIDYSPHARLANPQSSWHPEDSASRRSVPQSQAMVVGPSTSPAASMSLISETSFMTVLVFSSCIVILTLMSICLGLCLMIFRHNSLVARQQIERELSNSTSSSCNICGDDAQGASIDAVLAGHHRKDQSRGFSNVFAKLRGSNHHHQQQQQQPQTNQVDSRLDGDRHASVPVTASAVAISLPTNSRPTGSTQVGD